MFFFFQRTFSFALGGGGGAFLGTIFLANLSLDILSFGVGIIVIIFISFKFFVPTWKLEYKKSENLFFPFGFFGGIFQGAAGISAPISITFLNSFNLDRKTFIPTISVYFMMMSVFQAPALIHYEFMNLEIFVDMCNKMQFEPGRRKAVGDAVFGQVFQKFADPIVQVFQNPNANPDAVLDAYIAANFDWYKANPDMGGAWQVMCSLSIGSASMVTATSGAGLNKLRKSGALMGNTPSVWPSQAPEVFFQPNPKRK